MQLLGGQWAKESDDKAERYIAWLLENLGDTIQEKAPVVALCSNIIRDIDGVAELKSQTRSRYTTALQSTLNAFQQGSAVPSNTQLEILEALGQLGAAVKSHLIDATKANLFPIRRRAIEMLLPHLSDEELLELNHILHDRSREPIKTYLEALFDRDLLHAERLLDGCQNNDCEKLIIAVEKISSDIQKVALFARDFLWMLSTKHQNHRARNDALETLARNWPDEATRNFSAILLLKPWLRIGQMKKRGNYLLKGLSKMKIHQSVELRFKL